MNHILFMQEALKEGLKAYEIDEVPIGCVIEYKGNIIGRGFNQRNSKGNALFHAEIIAINQACKTIGDWRLEDATIYVTVEPCAMCSGAILQSRINTVVFGVYNAKGGCCGSILNLLDDARFNHRVNIISGVLEAPCKSIMQDFFKKIRSKG